MTMPESAEPTPAVDPVRAKWPWPRTIEIAVPLVLLLLLLFAARLAPTNWPFAIEATTDFARIELDRSSEVVWRLDGAVLCVLRSASASVSLPPATPESESASPVCGSRRWVGFSLQTIDEPSLHVSPGAADAETVRARFVLREDGSLVLVLGKSAGNAESHTSAISLRGVGLERHQPLPIDLMLIWPHQPASEVTERVFPFAGATTLGDDVAWSGEVQLQSGRIDVFSASLDSLGERALIASTQLLRGDRVDLEAGLGKPLPKGFLHVQRAGDAPSSTMHAVVFGSAESVKVVRYGDAGYRVAPGWWAQLTHHPYFSTLLLLLVALTAYLASYKDVLELLTHWGWRREAASKRSTDGL